MPSTAPTRIVLIHRYFWPDTSPYGILLRRIAEHLASQRNSVSVFTGEPTYATASSGKDTAYSDQLAENLAVRRVRLFPEKRLRPIFRVLNDLMFCIRLVYFVIRSKPEIIMCSTQPPVIGAAAAGWAARRVGAKFVYHLQDIHPEVVCETGHVKNSLAMRLLRAIDKRTTRKADRIVVLSQDMCTSMEERVTEIGDKISCIPNFNLPCFDEEQSPPASLRKAPNVFRLMFAGNIGRFQNLESIVEACLEIPKEIAFEFVLMGDGKAKKDLQEQAKLANDSRIRFIDRQPLAVAEPLMAEADLCVVSLEEKVYRYAFPSKLASYLSLGAAVLVVCEAESELSQLPLQHGFGLSCPQTAASEIRNQIEHAIRHPEKMLSMRERAADFFSKHFATNRVLPQWSKLFDDLQEDR